MLSKKYNKKKNRNVLDNTLWEDSETFEFPENFLLNFYLNGYSLIKAN